MNRALLIAGSLLMAGLAFAAGRMIADPTGASDVVQSASAQKPPKLGDPNLTAQTAREQLSKLPPTLWAVIPLNGPAQVDSLALANNLPSIPAVVENALPSPPPPPKVDPGLSSEEIAGQLSRAIAAVKRSNGVASLIVIDTANGVRRTLKVGDLYRDGWRVALIDTRSVTLARKSAKVAVPLGFGLRTASSATPYVPSPVNAASSAGNRSANSANPPNSSRPRRRIARPGTSDKQEI